jgi:hypothetical protein
MNIPKSTVGAIFRRREKVLDVVSNSSYNDLKGRKKLRTVEHPVLDEALYRWVIQQRKGHGFVTNDL